MTDEQLAVCEGLKKKLESKDITPLERFNIQMWARFGCKI